MKDIITVMKFTIKDMVKRKSFLISTVIILVLIVLGFNVPNIMKAFTKDDAGDKILIVDSGNIFEGNLEKLNQEESEYEIATGNPTFEQIKEGIENGEISSALVIEKEQNTIKIRYIVENATMMEGVPENLINAINTLYSNMQISKLGLTTEQLQSITPNFEFSLEQTEEEKANGNVFAMMLMSIVLFYAIYF